MKAQNMTENELWEAASLHFTRGSHSEAYPGSQVLGITLAEDTEPRGAHSTDRGNPKQPELYKCDSKQPGMPPPESELFYATTQYQL